MTPAGRCRVPNYGIYVLAVRLFGGPKMRTEVLISRKVRRRYYYSVPDAGAKVGLGRSESYEAVKAGRIPFERAGRLLLVPRAVWDRRVKRLLQGDDA